MAVDYPWPIPIHGRGDGEIINPHSEHHGLAIAMHGRE